MSETEKPVEPDAFHDEGYDETQQGQIEVVAGSEEHHRLLTAAHNVSHYADIHNVVIVEEEPEEPAGPISNVDVPHAQQEGNQLTCTMGNWIGVPASYTYGWLRDDVDVAGGATYDLVADLDVGHTFVCIVTATNEFGDVEAPPSNAVVVA